MEQKQCALRGCKRSVRDHSSNHAKRYCCSQHKLKGYRARKRRRSRMSRAESLLRASPEA